ncbi:Indoleamine 2,3-dioxygenase [Rickenella mellea]|uniref:Indoleamine 2,3-dioxygenase n=1 Tax=Rickenella mellea TaxID=50990 RepID=A0A4Y7PLX0_9AGAM|nr:Indoleamine 2,3-dioxygenase [Rickenella mellea]
MLAFNTSPISVIHNPVSVDFPESGFMPGRPPLTRLPSACEPWETKLDDAKYLILGDEATTEEMELNERWRDQVRKLPEISIDTLRGSEVLLRRARVVLTFLVHLYVHSQVPKFDDDNPSPHLIPRSVSLPLLNLCNILSLPPVLTYSDTVLYNWIVVPNESSTKLGLDFQTTFTQTPDEAHFYRISALIEVRGIEALQLMRQCLEESSIADSLSILRIATHLRKLAVVIDEMSVLLMNMYKGCDPAVFYHRIRPWFRGGGGGKDGRLWKFEGADDLTATKFEKLSGPSAGQSSIIHALDVFLGIRHDTHMGRPKDALSSPATSTNNHSPQASESRSDPTFMTRMQNYMPQAHREFLDQLRAHSPAVRDFVQEHGLRKSDNSSKSNGFFVSFRGNILRTLSAWYFLGTIDPAEELTKSYNIAVSALKRFRDGHIKIVRTYIIDQAARDIPAFETPSDSAENLRGTGGTLLLPFLQACGENTKASLFDLK